MAKITWVNHAGFILRNEQVVLLCDPWLEGPVFNNGWELLAPTRSDVDFSTLTHLWFSHEHPDHFNPRSLRRVFAAAPKGLQVLFQETNDKRLLKYCEAHHLPVTEIKDGQRQQIASGVHMTVGKNGIEDSWSMVEMDGLKYLNLNDCAFGSRSDMLKIRAITGPADVLLTQFSYAAKAGNTNDVAVREKLTKYFMQLIVTEAEVFTPKYVIPFASFKYFSHKDNFYLNQGMATTRQVHDFLKDKFSARTLILFPGEEWEYGQDHASEGSIAKYGVVEGNLKPVPYQEGQCSFDELVKYSQDFLVKVTAVHGRSPWLKTLSLSGFTKISIWLTDLGQAADLTLTEPLKLSSRPQNACDIEVSSPNIAFLFQNLFGANTLMVNGRYQSRRLGHFKLYIISHLLLMASADEPLSFSYVMANMLKIASTLGSRLYRF